MKIATWNVYSGSIDDRLADLSTQYETDVVAMQETAEPNDGESKSVWKGDKTAKGVSISSKLPFSDGQVGGECSPTVAVRLADSPLGPFNVLAVWAKPVPTYYADLTRTLDLYGNFIRERATVILGDFNMSPRLLEKGRQFYLLNGRLNHDFDVHSAYHEFTGERFGMETRTTLYYQWGTGGCFHCDFVYLPATWLPRLRNVTIPGYKSFDSSDHRPVVCDLA